MSMLEAFMAQNESYWQNYHRLNAPSGPPILVDMMHFNLEYVACGLSAGASLRTATNRPLVGLVGRAGILDPIFPPFEMEITLQLGRSFGVERFIDMHEEVLAAPAAEAWLNPIRTIATRAEEGERLSASDIDAVKSFRDPDGFAIGRFIMDTAIRGSRIPGLLHGPDLLRWVEYLGRARNWAKGLFDSSPVTAVAVGHTDYCPYGFIAEYGLSRETPTLLWSGSDRSAYLVTRLEADATLVGACREATRVAFGQHQAVATQRDKPEVSALTRLVLSSDIATGRTGLAAEMATEESVADLRGDLFAGDPRPMVCLFAHTYSDVPCQDEALFRDHLEWLEETLKFAVRSQKFNLLIKAHPQDAAYDLTNATQRLEQRFQKHANIAFCRRPITQEVIAEQCALGVTVRGTPGFLAPVSGLRMLLAGKSVFSDAGVAMTATSINDYFEKMEDSLDTPPMTAEEIDHAKDFLVFHLLTGSRRTALTPLLRGDGRNSPFFGWTAETLRTWAPEDCELSVALVEHWSQAQGFTTAAPAIRVCTRASRRPAAPTGSGSPTRLARWLGRA
jgi:hypothetical protein